MKKPSKLQSSIFEYIRSFIAHNGKAPVLDEIAVGMNINSRAAVLYHLRVLQRLQLIGRSDKKRGITLKDDIDFLEVEVLGIANAGLPLSGSEQDSLGVLHVDKRFFNKTENLFAVKIHGDSMNRQSLSKNDKTLLTDGNYAIIDTKAEYRDNDVVLAIVNSGATIKLYKQTPEAVILYPNSTNERNHPIFIKDGAELLVTGKVVLALEDPAIKYN